MGKESCPITYRLLYKGKRMGCKKMNIGIVEENTILRKWYEDNGFIHIGTKKFVFLFTCGYMERDL